MIEVTIETADRCPYPRPFSPSFSACPAFMPRLHLATDIRGQPLHAHWTCAHLASRRLDTGGGFYPACVIGTSAVREAWAAQMEVERLAAIRIAWVELSQSIRPALERLRAAIGRPFDPLGSERRAEARAAWSGLSAAFDDFVDAHRELFESAGINPAALLQCFAEATADFSSRQPDGRWQMSESIVTRYPWSIQAFFRPDLARDPGP
ncbi:MAG TPA: hypothetical protein VNG93_04680 [Candidatus Dormibacteraeota bacterium]|nr:hypothetical protein [Candidatus Dormibacteraeota bacterium]